MKFLARLFSSESKDANHRLDNAVEDLQRTISMSREEFCKMLQKDGECEPIRQVVNFQSFADICDQRSSVQNGSLMVVCKHPAHEANRTRIAACTVGLCPKLKDARK